MEQEEKHITLSEIEIRDSLMQIKLYLEDEIHSLKIKLNSKNARIKNLQDEATACQQLADGNRQLINKLLGDLSKLQNDIEWYKRTYEQRSFLGTIKEKIFRKKI